MSLYALGDLHLSFQSDKSTDIFGSSEACGSATRKRSKNT